MFWLFAAYAANKKNQENLKQCRGSRSGLTLNAKIITQHPNVRKGDYYMNYRTEK
jgi:hypothetical protein